MIRPEPGIRHFCIHGHASPDAVIEVWQNGRVLEPVLDQQRIDPFYDLGTMLYSFKTLTTLNGYCDIEIFVLQGSISIERTRVIYPAKVIDREGKVFWVNFYVFQNITDPKYLVRINGKLFEKHPDDHKLTGEFEYNISTGDKLDYYHLMYTGHEYLVVPVNVVLDHLTDLDYKDLRIIEIQEEFPDKLETIKEALLVKWYNS